MAIQSEQRDDLPVAETAYRAADQLGHAAAAVSLGVLLEERDDLAGAEPAYRRAELRGHPGAMVAPLPAPIPVRVPVDTLLLPPEAPFLGGPEPVAEPELIAHPEPMAEPEPEPELTEAPAYVEGPEPLTTSLAAFAPGDDEAPIEQMDYDLDDDAAADALAATIAARAKSKPHRAERAEGKPRPIGVVGRTFAIVIPVGALAAAFILGAATRPDNPPPAHPATAASSGTATVSSVTTVPRPARLVVKRTPVKKSTAKPKTTHTAPAVTHSTAMSHPVTSAPVVSSPPPSAPTHSTVTPTNVSGGASVSSSSGAGTVSGSG